jgi:hypothetical protein
MFQGWGLITSADLPPVAVIKGQFFSKRGPSKEKATVNQDLNLAARAQISFIEKQRFRRAESKYTRALQSPHRMKAMTAMMALAFADGEDNQSRFVDVRWNVSVSSPIEPGVIVFLSVGQNRSKNFRRQQCPAFR